MRKAFGISVIMAAMLSVILVAAPADAGEYGDALGTPGKVGAGITIGAPSGVTAKYYLTQSQALGFHVGGIPFFDQLFFGSLSIGGDYLLEFFEITDAFEFRMAAYVGGGGLVLFNVGGTRIYEPGLEGFVPYYDFGFGARFPGGVNAQLKQAPVELFVEISPSIALLFRDGQAPDMAVKFFHAALGARYYFN